MSQNSVKADVMDILLYIFERFQEDEFIPVEKAQSLVAELEKVGFDNQQIDSALAWLDGLVETASHQFQPDKSQQQSIRIYHPLEKAALSQESLGFLYFLEQMGVLDAHSREAVMDRVLALDTMVPMQLDDLKWVVMMVLFNLPGKEEAAVWLENMDACLH